MTESTDIPSRSRVPPTMAAPHWRPQMRFAAIWIAIIGLICFCAIVAPRSLLPSTFLAIIPLAAFLAIAAIGETLVLMARGIDLSIPAVITLSSTIILGFSGGRDEAMLAAVAGALFFSAAIGFINGLLVAVFELNALIVTLAVGAITSGITLWYRESLPQEARVPPGMATWGDARLLAVILNLVLRKTAIGRQFSAVGANPRAAWVAGLNVALYQMAAFTVAAFLYGIAGILVSAFIRNPTLKVGEPYLLAPIAAAVLGGTAMSGGIGSMVAVAGAALFLTQLGQVLQMLGLSSALQFVIEGIAIALGMAFSRLNFTQWAGPKNSIWRRKQNADGVGSKVAGENPFAVVNRHHRPPAI